ENIMQGDRVAGFSEKTAPARWRLNDYPEEATGVIFDFRVGEDGGWLKTKSTIKKNNVECGGGGGDGIWEKVLDGEGDLHELYEIEVENIPEEGKVFEGIEEIEETSQYYGDYIMTFEYRYEYK
ncbi:MAG: hypothetical protein JW944_05080, partial [Deltaproteobacteria bacterium]|nr:hypothetical protein [Deltaproteobacteria bacterium]